MPPVDHKDTFILAKPSGVGLSHLTRLQLIGRKLRDIDFDIVFALRALDGLLRLNEFRFRQVTDVDISDFRGNIFEAYKRPLINTMVDEELKVISSIKPQAILGDLSLTAAISSRLAGISYISVVNGYMTDFFDPVDAIISAESRPITHRIASVLGRSIQYVQKRALATEFRNVARSRGITDLISLYDFLRGDLTLIADLPQFCPLHDLPSNCRYIGPLIWEGTETEVSKSLKRLQESCRTIYATTGNTGSEKLIELVLHTFAEDQSYQLVVTTGAYIDPHRFPNVDNVIVERFIPGSEILKRCDIAIHCGGNGTTYQVLSQAVPAVVVPFNNDQRINAWLIKKNRVGIPLSPDGLTKERLKAAVELALRDAEMKENLRRFQELLKNEDGPRNAVEEIASFFHRG